MGTTKPEWLTARQAAQHLQLTLKGLYGRCSMRAIPHYRLGGSLRFKRDELDKFIERRRVAPVELRR